MHSDLKYVPPSNLKQPQMKMRNANCFPFFHPAFTCSKSIMQKPKREIYSQLTINTLEQSRHCSGVLLDNCSVFTVDFEQVNAGWVNAVAPMLNFQY